MMTSLGSRVRAALIILSILLLGGLLIRVSQLRTETPMSPEQAEETKTPHAEPDWKTITEDTERANIKVRYPVVHNPVLDRIIKERVESEIAQFRKDIAETMIEGKSELRIDYTTSQFSSDVRSIRFEEMVYVAGAAHPNNFSFTKTFDFSTGEEMKLSDIFLNDKDYLAEISEIAYAELSSEQYAVKEMVKEGTAPMGENYDAFMLNEQGITFIFNPYQVAAYVAGTKEVFISFDRLRELLQPRFIPQI